MSVHTSIPQHVEVREFSNHDRDRRKRVVDTHHKSRTTICSDPVKPAFPFHIVPSICDPHDKDALSFVQTPSYEVDVKQLYQNQELTPVESVEQSYYCSHYIQEI